MISTQILVWFTTSGYDTERVKTLSKAYFHFFTIHRRQVSQKWGKCLHPVARAGQMLGEEQLAPSWI